MIKEFVYYFEKENEIKVINNFEHERLVALYFDFIRNNGPLTLKSIIEDFCIYCKFHGIIYLGEL